MARDTLYVNNETLGSVEYIGTRDEWRTAMRIPADGWWREAVWEAEERGEEGPSFSSFMEDMLDKGLVIATEEKLTLDRVV